MMQWHQYSHVSASKLSLYQKVFTKSHLTKWIHLPFSYRKNWTLPSFPGIQEDWCLSTGIFHEVCQNLILWIWQLKTKLTFCVTDLMCTYVYTNLLCTRSYEASTILHFHGNKSWSQKGSRHQFRNLSDIS